MTMQILLVMRCQLICVCFLLMLFIYTLLAKQVKTRKEFQKICFTALLQNTFDLITIILVNMVAENKELTLINRVAHVFVVYFAIVFCYYFFCYVVKLIASPSVVKKVELISCVPVAAYIFLSPFKDFDYINGRGTYYVGGPYVEFWFMVAMIYVIIAMIMIFKYRSRLEKKTVITLETITSLMIVMIILQVVIPEFLFTGGSITLVTFAMYLTLENTAETSKYRATLDIASGVKSKDAFNLDMQMLNNKYFSEKSPYERIGMVMCDVFELKEINDTFGLITGDEVIEKTADILSKCLKKSFNIYRIRGDVFIALYLGCDDSTILEETLAVKKEVALHNKTLPYDYIVNIGNVLYDNTDIENIETIYMEVEKELSHQKQILLNKLDGKRKRNINK